jgi:hypothetical protein
MLRVVAAAFALALLAPAPASACPVAGSQYGIMFDEAPAHLEGDILILEVQFERIFEERDIGRARILNVVRGYYGWDKIEVSLRNDSCQVAPNRGDRGFIAGVLRTQTDGDALLMPYGAPSRFVD